VSKTSKLIREKLGFSHQQLYYWRKTGIIKPSGWVPGKHYQYSFQDIKTLKTIRVLRDNGISTYKIRKCLEGIKKHFPLIKNPFCEKPILIFGGNIVFIHEGVAYDAITGQGNLINFKEIEKWSGGTLGLKGYEGPGEDETIYLVEAQL